jgi:hypothetical protein
MAFRDTLLGNATFIEWAVSTQGLVPSVLGKMTDTQLGSLFNEFEQAVGGETGGPVEEEVLEEEEGLEEKEIEEPEPLDPSAEITSFLESIGLGTTPEAILGEFDIEAGQRGILSNLLGTSFSLTGQALGGLPKLQDVREAQARTQADIAGQTALQRLTAGETAAGEAFRLGGLGEQERFRLGAEAAETTFGIGRQRIGEQFGTGRRALQRRAGETGRFFQNVLGGTGLAALGGVQQAQERERRVTAQEFQDLQRQRALGLGEIGAQRAQTLGQLGTQRQLALGGLESARTQSLQNLQDIFGISEQGIEAGLTGSLFGIGQDIEGQRASTLGALAGNITNVISGLLSADVQPAGGFQFNPFGPGFLGVNL